MKWFLKVLQNYANFNGRASRSEYWYFVLFSIIFAVIIGVFEGLTRITFLGLIYNLALLIPSIAVGVRRMHDVNKSGWYLLIPIYSLILACTEGTNGENDYGPDPLNDMPDFDFENKDVIV